MRCRRRIATALAALAVGGLACPAAAVLVLDPPPEAARPAHRAFHEQLRAAVASLASSPEPHVRRLHAAASAAPATIMFRPITGDRRTWASDGDRNRGHTEPADGRPKREGRTRPTGAIVYLPASGVDMGSKRWKSGLLVHELVHALDLATGRYSRDNRVRERRAVFMQNIWRDRLGEELRTAYHGQFPTLDYQEAKRQGRIEEYAGYLFARNDFPVTPANGRRRQLQAAAFSTAPPSGSIRPAS